MRANRSLFTSALSRVQLHSLAAWINRCEVRADPGNAEAESQLACLCACRNLTRRRGDSGMSQREAERQHSEYVRLMRSMFDFLLTSGMEVKAIRRIVERALVEEGESRERLPGRTDFGLATAGRVL